MDSANWNKYVSHPLQSWEWGEFRMRMGIDVLRYIDESQAHTHWQISFHQIPKTPLVIGYIPKGPEPTEHILNALKNIGKEKHAVFIQLEPNSSTLQPATYNLHLLRPSHHPLFTKYTFVLDLTKSEDQLIAAMHAKTRYNIRVAERHGVKIQEDNSDRAFSEYMKLHAETLERQKFYAHSTAYHQKLWSIFHPAGLAKLFTATFQNNMIAAWIIFPFHDTLYYPYGASSRDHREVMAPTLLLWEIARWGKQMGYKAFDLWGALGPQPNPRDPWYGFHRFKEGFNPNLVEFIGSYDLIIKPTLYRLYTVADRLRSKALSLRKL
ncbi:MAG: peptidoglycan bridge formation glycyltransferase FemA/FemB family protein [bacterium]|nr:peptidoglycan bridge formation glycyltransferase FemA/FemB family protein [bacterium]